MTDQPLGNQICEAREAAGLSQTALGKLVGVSQTTISKVEQTGRYETGYRVIRAIQAALKISPESPEPCKRSPE